MISIFTRRDVLKSRHGILRGVYEENLSMLGKGRRSLPRRKTSPLYRPLNRIALYMVVCLAAFLIHGQYRGSSSPSVLTASMGREPRIASAAELVPAGMENTSEFRPLESSSNIPLSRMLGLGVKKIVIDAGHGGKNLGTVGKMGTQEKDITLDIAKRLKARLIKSGYQNIYMTREDDALVSLQERVTSAGKAKGDLLLSIHVNWLPNTPVNAVETYYFGPSRDQEILKLAEKENMGSEYGLSDFQKILEKLGKTMKLQESRKLAESIQSNIFWNSQKQNQRIKDNGVKRAPFVVLLGLDVPSVLAEVSCLSNAEEERELNTEAHRENIAGYLAAGIISYLNEGVPKNDITR
jgi:N-acetylmuramoyl-L-alanine amidase